MKAVNLVFPHQLFENQPLLENGCAFYLVEEYLFFRQYGFHQQKIAFHRASMKYYEDFLIQKGAQVHYIESGQKEADVRELIQTLAQKGIKKVHFGDPTDHYLSRRIHEGCRQKGIEVHEIQSPYFINSKDDLADFFKPSKKKFYQTSFYKNERIRLNILVDRHSNPAGGKWTFDADNRAKYPKNKKPPQVHYPRPNSYHQEAIQYVQANFGDHLGQLTTNQFYPTTHASAKEWLNQFFELRFKEFGVYEDAIVKSELVLNHSILTPMMNAGLLTPREVVDQALAHAQKHDIPLNSLEGFVRQIIGWREFIRGVYVAKGVEERTRNFWGFDRKIPPSFYTGDTGIAPIDQTIKKILKTGYCHHIERLMVLGNFMMLCEFDPDEVYKWFMELFIDSYDWVMVPNVYGMSQYADGGLMSTKPYISGSNYLMKMSDYPRGDWQQTWDALFWRFMNVNRDFFLKNPRLAMLVRSYDKMENQKQKGLMDQAEAYLSGLH